jgi:site-specific DNA recombinase
LVYSFFTRIPKPVRTGTDRPRARKHKVELISFVEPLTNDASGELFRKFIGIVNEFQSPKPRVRPPAQ